MSICALLKIELFSVNEIFSVAGPKVAFSPYLWSFSPSSCSLSLSLSVCLCLSVSLSLSLPLSPPFCVDVDATQSVR